MNNASTLWDKRDPRKWYGNGAYNSRENTERIVNVNTRWYIELLCAVVDKSAMVERGKEQTK